MSNFERKILNCHFMVFFDRSRCLIQFRIGYNGTAVVAVFGAEPTEGRGHYFY
jgi:hypothetical protein